MSRLRRRVRAVGPSACLAVAAVLAACGDSALPIPFVPTPAPTPEQPREVTITAVDRASGTPVAGAQLEVDGQAAQTDARGAATLTALRGASVRASAAGFDAARGRVPEDGDLVIELRSNVLRGTVTDVDGRPLARVRVFVEGDETLVRTDEHGRYELAGVPEQGTVIYKLPGHRLGAIPLDAQMTKDVALPRFEVRALYAPAAIFEAPGRLEAMLELIERTEANALVIDVKETDGQLYHATDLPQAVEAGAVRERPLFRLEELLPMLRERGIYTIARMVVMKDNTLGSARPDLAVMNTATGGPWRDNIGGIWLDPAAPGVADYAAAIAADLAARGFDEVQLDYIRFFSDGPYDVADTNLPNLQSFRLPALRHVLRVIADELETSRAFLAADVFPIPFIVPDDQGIGQRADSVMPYLDYVCPMSYPSHYGPGVFGFDVPNEHPYEVVSQTLAIMGQQAAGLPLVLRPWIQDFGYGQFRAYGPADVRAEMQAAADAGAGGWMIWNPGGQFTEAALGPPRPDEAAALVSEALPAAVPEPAASQSAATAGPPSPSVSAAPPAAP
jgi:hypothetical protein